MQALHPLRNGAVFIALPQELQQRHILAAPVAGLVVLHRLRLRLHARPGRLQHHHGASVAARREELREQVEPHLRLRGLVVEEHAPGHREGGRLVVEPLPRKAVRELRRVGRHVLQQEAAVVAVQDVLVALRDLQRLREVRAVALLLAPADV